MQTQIVEYSLNIVFFEVLDQGRALLKIVANQVEHVGVVNTSFGNNGKLYPVLHHIAAAQKITEDNPGTAWGYGACGNGWNTVSIAVCT